MKNKKPGDENPFGEDELVSLAKPISDKVYDGWCKSYFLHGMRTKRQIMDDLIIDATYAALCIKKMTSRLEFDNSLTLIERGWFHK